MVLVELLEHLMAGYIVVTNFAAMAEKSLFRRSSSKYFSKQHVDHSSKRHIGFQPLDNRVLGHHGPSVLFYRCKGVGLRYITLWCLRVFSLDKSVIGP
mgnify:CR=1 FL=1|jgi:hypothetical protein